MGRGRGQANRQQDMRTPVSSVRQPGDPTAELLALGIGSGTYVVGGAVRDELYGRTPKDFDYLVTGLDPEPLLDAYRSRGIRAKELVVADALVGVRIYPAWAPRDAAGHNAGIEICPPRVERPMGPDHERYTGNPHHDWEIVGQGDLPVEDDLARRDFTINAIARDAVSGEYIDPYGGRADARDRILRAVTPDSFRDDPVRILRGLARISKDGLSVEPQTLAMMREYAPRLRDQTAERVREELDKILSGDHAADALRLARDTGVLDVVLPEFSPAIGFDQENRHHSYTVDEHIFAVLDAACRRDAPAHVRLAALMHDIGKPATAWRKDPDAPNVDGGNPLHFYLHPKVPHSADHAVVGAQITESALHRLRYDNDTVRRTTHLVRHHMYPDIKSPAKQRRWLQRVGPEHLDDLVTLRLCDRSGKAEPLGADEERAILSYRDALREQARHPLTVKQLSIGGDDLRSLGCPPGPRMGEVLRELLDAVVADPDANEPGRLRQLAVRALAR